MGCVTATHRQSRRLSLLSCRWMLLHDADHHGGQGPAGAEGLDSLHAAVMIAVGIGMHAAVGCVGRGWHAVALAARQAVTVTAEEAGRQQQEACQLWEEK